jgi:hypothetical protein
MFSQSKGSLNYLFIVRQSYFPVSYSFFLFRRFKVIASSTLENRIRVKCIASLFFRFNKKNIMIFLKPSIEGLYIPVGAQCYLMDQVNELCLCYFGLSVNLIYFHFALFQA